MPKYIDYYSNLQISCKLSIVYFHYPKIASFLSFRAKRSPVISSGVLPLVISSGALLLSFRAEHSSCHFERSTKGEVEKSEHRPGQADRFLDFARNDSGYGLAALMCMCAVADNYRINLRLMTILLIEASLGLLNE